MFYSQFILAKKGPLGTIWIAAHLERKLRKNQVADTDIGHSVDSILFPDMPIALRLSSHLLLGVVRIYSRKVNYLFDDCSEALLKVKQAFRSTAVDLPPEESTAPYHSITLPETFDLDDFELPDNDLFQGNFVDHHVSTREQITLQDTMDSTVYSTSQFGLDERFGDGDTSQIGLDLEEELFSEKETAPVQDADLGVDPHASTQRIALTKDDEDNIDIINTSEPMFDRDRSEIGHLASNTEPMDYAQTPCTPGLVEEPMGEAFTCDSHLGPEDHISKQSMDIENMENVSGNLDSHQLEKDAVSICQNDSSNDTPNNKSLDENGHVLHNVEENPENLEHLSNTVPLDDHDSIKDLPNGVEDNRQIVCSSEPGAEQNESESCMDNSRQKVSSYNLKDVQGSGQPEGSPHAEVAGNAEISYVPGVFLAADDTCALGSSDKPELATDTLTSHNPNNLKRSKSVDLEESPSVSMRLLRPCNSHPNEYAISSDGMPTLEDGQDADNQERALQKTHLPDPTLSQFQPDNISSGEVDNDISHDNQSGNLNASGPSELPAPEKLLSVPEVLADKPNDLLAEFTPNKEGPAGVDADHTINTQISGKKRGYTESTLTMQSLNSEESLRVSRSKRTAESIPHDDDVLSSILVGRSSGLKMKPSPSAMEIPSSKRLKSSQRPSTVKRKVLMDDAMVLHGDIIRQQLVSTEDIRRIRKKAPCTRPEILLIQRQFLEDGIFMETIFTGMSVELNCLHCEAYDLSRIRVHENVDTVSSSELQNTAESSVRPTAPEGTKNEGIISVPSIGNNVEVLSAELNSQNDSLLDKDQVLDSRDINAAIEVVTEPENLHNQMLNSAADMDVERASISVDAEDRSAIHGVHSSLTPDPVSGEHKSEDYVGSGQAGAECSSPDMKLNTSVNEHALVVDNVSEKGFNSIEGTEDNVSIQVEGGSEYGTGKNVELNDNKDGSSIDVRADDGRDVNSLGMANNSYVIAPPEVGNCDNLLSGNSGQFFVELGDKGLDNSNKDVFPMEFPCEDKSQSSRCMHDKEPNIGFHVIEYPSNVDDSSVKDGEFQASIEADVRDGMDAESTVINQPVGEYYDDLENIRTKNDTEFLNEDDAEEGDGDFHTSEELENSGWSSRTRAVAKYLQNAFDKEALKGSNKLSVDSLLSGKTRKEASRMFFETLVLKTRDYIHVEQAKPLDNIILNPRLKLMKSEF